MEAIQTARQLRTRRLSGLGISFGNPQFWAWSVLILMVIVFRLPKQANFKEIWSENNLANFLSAHLTKPYSINLAEPQQIRQHSPLWRSEWVGD